MKKKPVQKRVSKSSRPVLTSPWKLGMLVSLLLVLVGVGVGGYLVSLYGIRFSWIATGPTGLSFDSFGFFREMYPLVAVVTIVSLIAYFLVASSVRRYRCYLDSGQDYRRMISLAQSIDDLTDPAQIGRLSAYPELQRVLSAYGDQIREIAQDIGQERDPVNMEDFEKDVEVLLGEGGAGASAFESKPHAKGMRRIVQRLAADHAKIAELSAQGEAGRQLIGCAALACGRIVEETGGLGEELAEMANSINDLDCAARKLAAVGPSSDSSETAGQDAWKAAADDVANAARTLENGKTLLQELGEENNGVAIALALAAARDKAGGHELAGLADRIRISAERFNSLSETIEALGKKLLSACYALKEVVPSAAVQTVPAESDAAVRPAIVDITGVIERRSASLQERICALRSELQDMHALFQTDFTGEPSGAEAAESAPDGLASIFEGAEQSPDARLAESFVIDHGSAWAGMSPAAEEASDDEMDPSEPPESSESETLGEPSEKEHEQPEDSCVGDFSDMSSLRDLNGAAKKREAAVDELEGEAESAGTIEEADEKSEGPVDEREAPVDESASEPEASPSADGAWMEMPGHRWRKIDIEKGETDEPGAVDVTVEAPEAAAADASDPGPSDEEEERIYDLSELGAIEYVEELHAQR